MKELFDFFEELDTLSPEGRQALDAMMRRNTELNQLPMVAQKVMRIIDNPNSTAGDLERVILNDQALTTKILKIANSSFYGLLRAVSTLQRAILVVGFKAVKDIAVSTAILNMYKSSDPLSIKLWERAVGAGIAARMLSLEFESTDVDESFIGGLLHGMGKVLLLRNYPEETRRVYEIMQDDPDSDEISLEMEIFQFAHTHVSGEMARNWNLSNKLESVLRYHRNLPEMLWTDLEMEIKTNIAIVSLALRFCRHLGIGWDEPHPNFNIADCAENDFLRVPKERLDEMLEQIKLAFFSESQLFA